jgi:SET domain-containing protein
MLLVPTFVGLSEIHGIGVFTRDPIARGEKVLEYTVGIDSCWSDDEIIAMPEVLQRYLYSYLWRLPGTNQYILDVDSGRYINHSETPNLKASEDAAVAKFNISVEEELTIDYREFCYTIDPLFAVLKIKFGIKDDLFLKRILGVDYNG